MIDHTSASLVLVVGDDAVNRLVIRQMVQLSGYACLSAMDGLEGYQKTVLHTPALVLTDLHMPVLSGVEMISAIREALGAKTPPILTVLDAPDPALQRRALGTGAAACLIKPLRLETVQQALQAYLTEHSAASATVTRGGNTASNTASNTAASTGARRCRCSE